MISAVVSVRSGPVRTEACSRSVPVNTYIPAPRPAFTRINMPGHLFHDQGMVTTVNMSPKTSSQ